LGYGDLFGFDWGNATATVRWNHIFNEKLFSNTTLIYSDFTYNVKVNNDDSDFKIASKIRNWNLKQDFSYYSSNNNTLKFGLNVLRQQDFLAIFNVSSESGINLV